MTDNVSVLLALIGQQASKNLASAEKMSLGGPNGVRAYPVGEATGDSGLLITGRGALHRAGRQVVRGRCHGDRAFYDWGQVDVNEKPLPTDAQNKRSISGYGFGAVARQGRRIRRPRAARRGSADARDAAGGHREPRSARLGAGGEVVLRQCDLFPPIAVSAMGEVD